VASCRMGVTLPVEALYQGFISDNPATTLYHGIASPANTAGLRRRHASLSLLKHAQGYSAASKRAISRCFCAWRATRGSAGPRLPARSPLRSLKGGEFPAIFQRGWPPDPSAKPRQWRLLRPLGHVVYLLPRSALDDASWSGAYAAIEDSLDHSDPARQVGIGLELRPWDQGPARWLIPRPAREAGRRQAARWCGPAGWPAHLSSSTPVSIKALTEGLGRSQLLDPPWLPGRTQLTNHPGLKGRQRMACRGGCGGCSGGHPRCRLFGGKGSLHRLGLQPADGGGDAASDAATRRQLEAKHQAQQAGPPPSRTGKPLAAREGPAHRLGPLLDRRTSTGGELHLQLVVIGPRRLIGFASGEMASCKKAESVLRIKRPAGWWYRVIKLAGENGKLAADSGAWRFLGELQQLVVILGPTRRFRYLPPTTPRRLRPFLEKPSLIDAWMAAEQGRTAVWSALAWQPSANATRTVPGLAGRSCRTWNSRLQPQPACRGRATTGFPELYAQPSGPGNSLLAATAHPHSR